MISDWGEGKETLWGGCRDAFIHLRKKITFPQAVWVRNGGGGGGGGGGVGDGGRGGCYRLGGGGGAVLRTSREAGRGGSGGQLLEFTT